MKYITRDSNGVKVVSETDYVVQKGLIQYINELCIQELSTYEGRIQSVKSIFQFHTNIPVYVNAGCILIPTKSVREMDMVYINYHRLIGIQKDDGQCVALFDDHSRLRISSSFSKMQKQIRRVETLLAYYPH